MFLDFASKPLVKPVKGVTKADDRLHYLDASRAVMLLLGIPFHASESYRISGGFPIASVDTSYIASLISASVHCFRMPAFFMLSGFFAALLLNRQPSAVWLKGRAERLGVPLVFTTFCLGPFEYAFELMYQRKLAFPQALLDALTGPWSAWIDHRWFLIVLFAYCCVAAGLHGKFDRSEKSHVFAKLPLALPIVGGGLLALSPFMAIAAGKSLGDFLFHSVVVKGYVFQFVKYAPYFAFGYYVKRRNEKWFLSNLAWPEMIFAILTIAIYIGTNFSLYNAASYEAAVGSNVALKAFLILNEAASGYFASRLFFFGMGAAFSNPNDAVKYFVKSSFVIYLLHKIFLNMGAIYFLEVKCAPVLEISIISLFALIASVSCYEAIRRSSGLIPTFGAHAVQRL